MNDKNLFSLVIPTYDERENILTLLSAAHSALGQRPHEIIVVDDDSPDLTWKVVEEFSATHSWARSIRRRGERGLSSAVIVGFESARGDVLGVMDADLSHDETILPALLDRIEGGADMAIGSRRIKGGGATHWPWYRRLTSSVATRLAQHLLRLEISDPMSGYFVLRRSVYEAARKSLKPTGYKILLELYCRARPRTVAEVPFVFRDRRQGHSKLSGSVIRQFLSMVRALRRDAAKR